MEFSEGSFYKLLGPRLTICVSTITKDETTNLAPYSFATPVSFSPPLMGVSVGEGKDTLLNARETGDFVVIPLTKSWMEKGIMTEVELERTESEFDEVGLTEQKSEKVKSSGVEEAPINIECEYYDDLDIGDHHLLVGEVVNINLAEDAVKNGRINLEEHGSIGHICGEEFSITEKTIKIERQ